MISFKLWFPLTKSTFAYVTVICYVQLNLVAIEIHFGCYSKTPVLGVLDKGFDIFQASIVSISDLFTHNSTKRYYLKFMCVDSSPFGCSVYVRNIYRKEDAASLSSQRFRPFDGGSTLYSGLDLLDSCCQSPSTNKPSQCSSSISLQYSVSATGGLGTIGANDTGILVSRSRDVGQIPDLLHQPARSQCLR